VTNDGRVTEHMTTTDVPYKGKDEVRFYIESLEVACCYRLSKKDVSTKTVVTFNRSF